MQYQVSEIVQRTNLLNYRAVNHKLCVNKKHLTANKKAYGPMKHSMDFYTHFIDKQIDCFSPVCCHADSLGPGSRHLNPVQHHWGRSWSTTQWGVQYRPRARKDVRHQTSWSGTPLFLPRESLSLFLSQPLTNTFEMKLTYISIQPINPMTLKSLYSVNIKGA